MSKRTAPEMAVMHALYGVLLAALNRHAEQCARLGMGDPARYVPGTTDTVRWADEERMRLEAHHPRHPHRRGRLQALKDIRKSAEYLRGLAPDYGV